MIILNDCLFCKIIKGEIPSSKVFENEYVYAFKDIDPQAPVHYIFIPKAHIKSADEINEENAFYISEIFKAINYVAKKENLSKGYRIINNCGQDAGQTVHHIHFHLIYNKKCCQTKLFQRLQDTCQVLVLNFLYCLLR